MNCTPCRSESFLPKVVRLVTRAVAISKARCAMATLAHVETIAFTTQKILSRDFKILDVDLGVATTHDVRKRTLDTHRLHIALDDVSRVRQLHEEGRELLMARRIRIGLGHHQCDV